MTRTIGIHDDPVVVENPEVNFAQLKTTIKRLGENGDFDGLVNLSYEIRDRSDVALDPNPGRRPPGERVPDKYGCITYRPMNPITRQVAYELDQSERKTLLEEIDSEILKCIVKEVDITRIEALLNSNNGGDPLGIPKTWLAPARLKRIQLLIEKGNVEELLKITELQRQGSSQGYYQFAIEAGLAALEIMEAKDDKNDIIYMASRRDFFPKSVCDAAEQKALRIIPAENDTEFLLEIARRDSLRETICLSSGLRAVTILVENKDFETLQQIADDKNRKIGCPGGKWELAEPAGSGSQFDSEKTWF